ncbi:MAG: hypothetical protein K2K56_01930 [Lachnospiraceae bacterium]|nr:hypothetical protein [Lachnospiraceae bacterium]
MHRNRNDKERMKRICMIILMGILSLSFMGCGKLKTESQAEQQMDERDMVYSCDMLNPQGVEGIFEAFAVFKERVYFITGDYQNAYAAHLYSMGLDGKNVVELSYEGKENESAYRLTLDLEGNLYFIVSPMAEEDTDVLQYLVKINAEGQEQFRVDVTKAMELGETDAIAYLVVDGEGNIGLATEKSLFLFDQSGKLYKKLDVNAGIKGVARDLKGNILCAYENEKGACVQVLDKSRREWTDTYVMEIPAFAHMNAIMSGNTYDFYYRDSEGIYGYNIQKERGTKILDYIGSYLNMLEGDSLLPVEKNLMLGLVENNGQDCFAVYSKVAPEDVVEKQVITLGGAFANSSSSLQSAVVAFNRQSREYEIEIKDYSGYPDPNAQFCADLVAGNVPDIIQLDGSIPRNRLISMGAFENLVPYIEQDCELAMSDFIEPVMEAMMTDGKLYHIAPAFQIETMVSSVSLMGDSKGLTLEEMFNIIEENKDTAKPFYWSDKTYLLEALMAHNLTDFIDWDTGVCHFDSNTFRKVLEISNTGDDGRDMIAWGDTDIGITEMLQSGRVLFDRAQITSLIDLQSYSYAYGENNISFIGYPNDFQNGTFFAFDYSSGEDFAISVSSACKEGAWEFVRTYLTKECGIGSLPIRKDAYERMVEAGMDLENPITGSIATDGGITLDLRPVTKEEVDLVNELIWRTDREESMDDEIFNMITEEARMYFSGEKGLDETVSIIQDRVTTFVNETR